MCFDIGIAKCGPNEAMIISGVFYGNEPAIIVGGCALVVPCFQRVQRMPLTTLTLAIDSPRVYTSQGVSISVNGVAQVKINGQNESMLKSAAEHFGGKKESEIANIARETLEGHQRAIMGIMTVEEIYRDRKTFSEKVFEHASTDLFNMGIVVISYTIHGIHDEVGYLKALGLSRISEVQRDARIGEAEAKMESRIAQAKADLAEKDAVFSNGIEVARAQRDFDVKKAAYDIEVNTAKAEAELAFKLQESIVQQRISEENKAVLVVERKKQIEVEEQELLRKEKELEATVKRPAEAEKYKVENLALAERKKIELEAEAAAEALTVKGEAEAFAIEAKAKAEAGRMEKMADDGWNEYGRAAMLAMYLDVLPRIATEIATPLAQTERITMVADGDGAVGPERLTGEVFSIMGRMPELIHKLTGVDIASTMIQAKQ